MKSNGESALSPPKPESSPVLLVVPPVYYPWPTPPGVAYLAGFLREHGIPVRVLDANTQALEHILVGGSDDQELVRSAIVTLRDPDRARKWQLYEDAVKCLNREAQRVSRPFGESLRFERNTVRYRSMFQLRSRAGLVEAAERWAKHLFVRYYIESFIPAVRRIRPSLIGFSATDLHQLLPASVMAAVLRAQLGPNCPTLVFGGNVFSRISDVLSSDEEMNKRLNQLWGTVIVGEGERPLLELAKACSADGATLEPEGALVTGRPGVRKQAPISLDDCATPILEELAPLTPAPALPLNIYRGCYYAGVCGFCDINHGYDSIWSERGPRLAYRARRLRSLDRVIGDIKFLTASTGSRIVSFTDEWFRAREMRAFAERILGEDLRIQWEAYARFEHAFTDPEFAALLSRSGARFFQFGLESAADATLKSVHKGTTSQLASRVLRTLAAARIWNHVFVIVGLPGERLHDTLATVHFLTEHARSIFTIKATRFRVSRHSPYAVARSDKDIRIDGLAADRDLDLNLPFSYAPVPICRRCRKVRLETVSTACCSVCGDHLWQRPLLSHRAVNTMHTVLELLATRHWAYPFTSLYPYNVRLLFSPDDAVQIASERADRVDHDLGLTPEQVSIVLDGLRGYLSQERDCFEDIQARYALLDLDGPPRFETVQEVSAFAGRWAQAAKTANQNHAISHIEASTALTVGGDIPTPRRLTQLVAHS